MSTLKKKWKNDPSSYWWKQRHTKKSMETSKQKQSFIRSITNDSDNYDEKNQI